MSHPSSVRICYLWWVLCLSGLPAVFHLTASSKQNYFWDCVCTVACLFPQHRHPLWRICVGFWETSVFLTTLSDLTSQPQMCWFPPTISSYGPVKCSCSPEPVWSNRIIRSFRWDCTDRLFASAWHWVQHITDMQKKLKWASLCCVTRTYCRDTASQRSDRLSAQKWRQTDESGACL